MKKTIIFVISACLLLGSVCYAIEAPPIGNGTIISNSASEPAGKIIGAIQFIGYAIAIGMLIYVGIKYVMSSAQDKASLKNNLIRYVIGAIIVAGATTILPIITGLAGDSSSNNSGQVRQETTNQIYQHGESKK